ncbi:MAG: rhamnulokinase [Mycoplasmatales bacterium]
MNYITIDLGATSGRVILVKTNEQKEATFEVIRRFSTKFSEDELGNYIWPIESIFENIKQGLKKVNHLPIQSIGIDSWAVDFLLVNEQENTTSQAVSYRDKRTNKVKLLPKDFFGEEKLYQKNGIFPHQFNTINQLAYLNEQGYDFTNQKLLLIPDYLNYLLTGKMYLEYTNMTTTNMLNEKTKELDTDILQFLNMDTSNYPKSVQPTNVCGQLTKVLKQELGFKEDINVINIASHDTASAFLCGSAQKDSVILVSGTWSLLGINTPVLHNDKEFLTLNFSNEGGYKDQYRLLKNVMGMWVFESVCKEFDCYDYSQIIEDVQRLRDFDYLINLDEAIFLNPVSMKSIIQEKCQKLGYKVPQTQAEFAKIIFHSLAKIYSDNILNLESLVNKKFQSIYLLGGGSQNEYLNELITKYTNLELTKGPIEASAFGNFLIQALTSQEITNLNEIKYYK